MAQAPDYNRSTDFTAQAGDNTDHAALNAELDNAAASINTINSNLALIQGYDGKLLPDAVTLDSVSDDVIDFIADSIEQEIGDDIQRAEDAALAAESSATEATTSASASAASSSAAASYASAASASATAAADSAAQAAQSKQDSAQIKDEVQAMANAASASAVSAAGSATQAAGHKQDAAQYRDEAQQAARAAASSSESAEASTLQASLHEQRAIHASDDAREWAEASAASANTAATSANTAAGSATSAAGSANAALTAAQSSGAHVMAAIASKDAAAESAAKAAAAAAEAAASAGKAGEGAEASMPGAMSATAGGTPDVITACFKGGVSEPPKDHVVMYVRAIGANETTTPTFKPGGATPRVIVKGNNLPLAVGDIAGAGFEMLLQYNAEYDRFVLLNPAWGVFGSGGIPVGMIVTYGGTTVPAGFLSINRESLTCVGVDTYPQLAEAVWCGAELNESADFFYRCDAVDGSGRNVDGQYLVLPAASKYFLRGRDASGEVHPYQYQDWAIENIVGEAFYASNAAVGLVRDSESIGGTLTGPFAKGTSASPSLWGMQAQTNQPSSALKFDASLAVETDSETRPMNFPVMVLIKAFDATLNPGMVDITALANDVNQKADRSELIQSTIIYPNGGTAENPMSIARNERIVMDNPFPGYFVFCQAQIQLNGKWGTTGFYGVSTAAYGVDANQLLPEDTIIIQSGHTGLITSSSFSGGSLEQSGNDTNPWPCRIIVTRLGKLQ